MVFAQSAPANHQEKIIGRLNGIGKISQLSQIANNRTHCRPKDSVLCAIAGDVAAKPFPK
jgi:hypothetical protein